jgi:hypothetical protein
MITGSINMAVLKHVIMEKKGKDGQPLKGMFIPIEANRLQEHSSGGIYLNVVAFELKEPKDWATHIVKQSFTKKERGAMGEDELSGLPILGNIKVSDGTPPAQDNNAAPDQVMDGDSDDDLPF